jgi:hypothetical protein
VPSTRRYLCGAGAAKALVAAGAEPRAEVKVERPQRSEDERP